MVRDNDFYCCSYNFFSLKCVEMIETVNKLDCHGCKNYRRKHPTPEQYKEEYGEEWKGAVYYQGGYENDDFDPKHGEWFVGYIRDAEQYKAINNYQWLVVVCACTPFFKFDEDWKPE